MSKPTKAKSLVNKTAEDLGEDPNLVQDLVDFYYIRLRKMMQSLEHQRINIPYLGTFEIQKTRLNDLINKTGNTLKSNKLDSFKDAAKYAITKERFEKASVLLKIIEKDEQEREQRYEDLGKPKRNLGRTNKPSDKK